MGDGTYTARSSHPGLALVHDPGGQIVPDVVAELNRLRSEAETLRREIAIQNASLHEKNVKLDALHFVWCSGTCKGMHRWCDAELTTDMVAHVQAYAIRLLQKWPSVVAHGAPDEDRPALWAAAYRALAAKLTAYAEADERRAAGGAV